MGIESELIKYNFPKINQNSTIIIEKIMLKKWIIYIGITFAIIYTLIGIYYIYIDNKNKKYSVSTKLWNENSNNFNPKKLTKFQLFIWRLCLLSRWIITLTFGFILFVELLFSLREESSWVK